MGLVGLPASDHTVIRFLVFKGRSCKYSTITNYLSAIIGLHRYYGYAADFRDSYSVHLVLEGLKRKLGTATLSRSPLNITQLLQMSRWVSFENIKSQAMWAAIVFCFRTLLRKSNVLPDTLTGSATHVILRKHIEFIPQGMMVHVYSSKTLKHKNRVLRLPVYISSGSPLCAVSQLRYHWSKVPGKPDDPLFMCNKYPLLYRDVLSYVKLLVERIGLDPSHAGLHSLRRSGALFLHSIGIPLTDIQTIGDWSSLAALLYLVTPMDRKIDIEHFVSNSIVNFT